jgi:hypothetical protein
MPKGSLRWHFTRYSAYGVNAYNLRRSHKSFAIRTQQIRPFGVLEGVVKLCSALRSLQPLAEMGNFDAVQGHMDRFWGPIGGSGPSSADCFPGRPDGRSNRCAQCYPDQRRAARYAPQVT